MDINIGKEFPKKQADDNTSAFQGSFLESIFSSNMVYNTFLPH